MELAEDLIGVLLALLRGGELLRHRALGGGQSLGGGSR